MNRDHPAIEVYVTGTFDDWGKSVKLEKEAGGFVKRVDLPLGEKIYYKVGMPFSFTTISLESLLHQTSTVPVSHNPLPWNFSFLPLHGLVAPALRQ